MNPARRTLDPRAKLYLLLVANLMLFFHVGLATQIVMVVLFLLPLLAAARWRTALNFGVTYAVLAALGMLDPDALGLPWLHVVSALAVGVTMMLPCFITGAHGSTAWPTGTWYSTADISCRITRPMNSCPSPPAAWPPWDCGRLTWNRIGTGLRPWLQARPPNPAPRTMPRSPSNGSPRTTPASTLTNTPSTMSSSTGSKAPPPSCSAPLIRPPKTARSAGCWPSTLCLRARRSPRGGLLSHLHFQYANDLHTLVATDEATGAETLRNPRWYAHHVRQRGNRRGPLRHHPCVAPLAVDLATYGGMTAPR